MERILKALSALKNEDFDYFKFHLKLLHLEGKDPIQEGPLDGANRMQVTQLISQKYPSSDLQGQVMKIVLDKINRPDLALTFEDTTLHLPEASGASTQGTPESPDKTMLVTNKTKLVELFSADLHIIQHAQSDGIITQRVYTQLMAKQPEDACINLLDTIIRGGERLSSQFLRLLKKTEILNTYPQLRDLL